jgi:hypothetical protein
MRVASKLGVLALLASSVVALGAEANCKEIVAKTKEVTKARDTLVTLESTQEQVLLRELAKAGELGVLPGGHARNARCHDLKEPRLEGLCKSFLLTVSKRKDFDLNVADQQKLLASQCTVNPDGSVKDKWAK